MTKHSKSAVVATSATGRVPVCLIVLTVGTVNGGCRLGGYLSVATLVFMIMLFIGIFWCACCVHAMIV